MLTDAIQSMKTNQRKYQGHTGKDNGCLYSIDIPRSQDVMYLHIQSYV